MSVILLRDYFFCLLYCLLLFDFKFNDNKFNLKPRVIERSSEDGSNKGNKDLNLIIF